MAQVQGQRSLLAQVGATVVRSHMIRTIGAYRPQPSVMHLPGLHQQPVYSPDDFPWVPMLRENMPLIREEYQTLRANGAESDYTLKLDEHQVGSTGYCANIV